jgi:hypothetical protein
VIRRGLALTLTVLTLAALCAATDLPNQWRAWHYSRALQTSSAGQRSPFALKLPFDLLARSDVHGSDIRVIDDQGQEVPYALNRLQGDSKTQVLPSHLLERSFVAGQFTQITVGVTDKPALDDSHDATLEQLQAGRWFNTYRIITSESDFMFWVETSVSDDAHQWRVVDARSPISRFRKHGLDGNQAVQFEGYSNQRFLRVRVFDPDRQFAVDSVEVLSRQSTEPPRIFVSATFSPKTAPESTESRLCTDLTSRNFPVSEVDFSTNQPEFYRAVRISTSEDEKDWAVRASGEIYRFTKSGKLAESLRISFPESFERFWCVDVINGNDRPLSGLTLDLRGIERRITFQAEPNRTYRLIYDNSKASAPQYDFAHIFDFKKVLPIANLGPEELTANYADPRPFTERHPLLLWFALIIAVVLLAYSALRALRAPGPAAS